MTLPLALAAALSLQLAPMHLLDQPPLFAALPGGMALLPPDELALEVTRLEGVRSSLVPSLIFSGVGLVSTAVGVPLFFTGASAFVSVLLLLAGPLMATIAITALVAILIRNGDAAKRLSELTETSTRPETLGAMSGDGRSLLMSQERGRRRSVALPVVLLSLGTAFVPLGGVLAAVGLVASVTLLFVGPLVVLVGAACITAGIFSLVAGLTENSAIDGLVNRTERAPQASPEVSPASSVPSVRLAPLSGLQLARF